MWLNAKTFNHARIWKREQIDRKVTDGNLNSANVLISFLLSSVFTPSTFSFTQCFVADGDITIKISISATWYLLHSQNNNKSGLLVGQ